jgi:hypothetical protein
MLLYSHFENKEDRNVLLSPHKYHPMKKALLFLVFTCFQLPGFATNYYVATPAKGGSDANVGISLSTPYATIAKALSNTLIPGDTIFVRSGTYPSTATVKITQAGTAAKHLVLTVYKPDMVNADSRPVFDFSSMGFGSSNRGFLLTGANYWDIYGIVIKGAGDNGMNIGATSFSTLTFCSFLRNRDTGLQMGGGSHHLTITNCDSYENADLGPGSTSNGGNADGFSPKLDVGDSILFRGCRAWMNSDDGWDGYMRTTADGVTTFLEDCWAFHNGYYWLDGSTTTNENGNGFKMGGSDNKDLSHNFVLVKCLSFYNKANGFDQNNNAGSIYLYNCSGYQNGLNDYGLNSSGITYKPGAQLVLKNNLSLGTNGNSIPATTASRPLTSVTNSFKTTASSVEILSFDTAGTTGMRSVDGSLPVLDFMRLNISAPSPFTYIDKGTVLSDIKYHGQMGVPYMGTAPDLGAFESNKGIVNDLSDAFLATSSVTAFPDPFASSLTFRYDVPSPARAEIALMNTLGVLVYTWASEDQQVGQRQLTIDTHQLASGMYFLKLKIGDKVMSRSLVKE